MDKVLLTELFISCFVYLDDIVVFGKTAIEVIERTLHISDLIRAGNMKIGELKCYFLLWHIQLLGKNIEVRQNFLNDNKL